MKTRALRRRYGHAAPYKRAGLVVLKKDGHYDVIHEASGLPAGGMRFAKLKTAKIVLDTIAPLAPWRLSMEKFRAFAGTAKGAKMAERVRKALNRLEAEGVVVV